MTQSTDKTPRQEFIDGLRALAFLLDDTPELPLPYLSNGGVAFAAHMHPTLPIKAAMAELVRLIPGRLDKNDPGTGSQYDADYLELRGSIGALPVRVWAERPKVCERVVTGTREVVKTVPTATKKVTVTEDVVEWICSPLLADAVSA